MADDPDLGRYIQFTFAHLLTNLERRTCAALLLEAKATSSTSPGIARVLRERSPGSDADVRDALKGGATQFWASVRDRLLREHPQEFILARCRRCSRLLRTPKSKQCLACGLDWH